jgi:hypothetical protein
MKPGPDQIVACPHCHGLARYTTLLSGNTFGATVWTDGKQFAPMLPRPPAVVKCRHCPECYWLKDAEEIGKLDCWGSEEEAVDPAWRNAKYVEEPSEEEYYSAIDRGLARDREEERSLRILAWWRRNDAFRRWSVRVFAWWRRNVAFRKKSVGQDAAPASSSVKSLDNLKALAGLLDLSDENDRVMKAELLRELGEFEAATAILDQIGPGDYASVARQLRILCEVGDASVRRLKLDT